MSASPRLPRRALFATAAAAVLIAAGLTACGDSGKVESVRLGYFPNLTHATAIVGVQEGLFQKSLGATKLTTQTFNAGPAEIEALFSGAIDIGYIGPSPTVNAYVKSKGKALKVISGSASGGVLLVVKPGIKKPADLKGKKIATPQLGNTQDVALRYWLKQQGFTTTKDGGGDVHVTPQENPVTVEAFGSGAIDGAWVPEPTASTLVKAGGHVLVDERDLWPGKKFVITNVIVRTEFLQQHPDLVKAFLKGQVAATRLITGNPAKAQQDVITALGKLTGKPPKAALVASAWKSIEFTNDPLASTLVTGANHAVEIGLLDKPNLTGLYDLTILNQVLTEAHQPTVPEPST
ncbi:ABC transporter substrate-binding protein [Fodinicola acaciae]|uniref:ABC transporter substrate-binding protein n=1 Tax=Fodinicola acaciae TaxID=2681555 RepID=UPI0013D65EB8|nr:ABC transporter substrate-binding protein [Fodinicola acaciae]